MQVTTKINKSSNKLKSYKLQAGFTLIELLVVVAITAILTTVVAVNFQSIRATQELNAARADLISRLRQYQGYALAGKQQGGISASNYIINFTPAGSNYQVNYTPSSTGVPVALETVRYSEFGQRVTLNSITVNGSGTGTGSLQIDAPYGTLLIGGTPNNVMVLQLVHSGTGLAKDVVIDGISGRISVQ